MERRCDAMPPELAEGCTCAAAAAARFSHGKTGGEEWIDILLPPATDEPLACESRMVFAPGSPAVIMLLPRQVVVAHSSLVRGVAEPNPLQHEQQQQLPDQ
jgi:hypothetical protein